MNYKETIYFVGKCLTISQEKNNKIQLKKQIISGNVDWDNVIKISTKHYVFPALYCNLKRANLLSYLPKDLVAYMKHITELNRKRNKHIIEQAKEINRLLLDNNITPVFLKGTGNLLNGLYEDIAERMVGDIDCILTLRNCNRAYEVLHTHGYTTNKRLFADHRHLPRLVHPNRIAAVELHKEMLLKSKSSFFNFNTVAAGIVQKDNISHLSLADQIKLTVFSKMINDREYIHKTINLRAAYDYYLLSKKLPEETDIIHKELGKELNAGIHLYAHFLAKSKNITFKNTSKSKKHTHKVIRHMDHPVRAKIERSIRLFYLKTNTRIAILTKALYNDGYRQYVKEKFSDKEWLRSKFSG
ncbi:nucleotidyltransferase family protein [Tenacibaculum sp. SG-28]|uniref:nucleotidyltransferase family protein n=1 Tax=Tenacibaculum sp. SG-28 TaxID=754426 RepID=UPI000CF3F1DD|nr:nucleotidyltransferase family protein [Tenacibaculum sp. SG-28]PQJ20636.1 hypothetical protein BSU00_10035 [Tenacibaculum sp. SG-28]